MAKDSSDLWTLWFAIGILGQVAFSSRFLVQWIASERCGTSVLPTAFWWLSLVGSVLLLVYAIARRDPVFAVGQSAGLFIYCRNLALDGRPSSR